MNKRKAAAPKPAPFDPKKYEKTGITEGAVLEIKEAFDLFDENHNGTIERMELKQVLENCGVDADNKAIANILKDIDTNGSGDIDFDEFMSIMSISTGENETKEDLKKIYDLFLGENAGEAEGITVDDLKRVIKEINDGSTDEELEEMIMRADLNNDKVVNFEEFYEVITKKFN